MILCPFFWKPGNQNVLKDYTKSYDFYTNLPFEARNHGNLETIQAPKTSHLPRFTRAFIQQGQHDLMYYVMNQCTNKQKEGLK